MLREQRYEVLGYFIEKKTKEEYARERFKKKYNYVPDKTKGRNDPYHGTITDDKGKIIHRFLNDRFGFFLVYLPFFNSPHSFLNGIK